VAHHLPAYLPPRTAHLTPGAWDHDTRLTWADLAWLRDVTSLPIVVKGVMSTEDALTLGGARTVTDMLRLLQYQLEVSMARVGVTSVAEIDSRIVRRAPAGSSPDGAPHDDSGSGAMSMCTPS
ncbi:MAG: 4-hydroxymandelate oxidase, partial [Pseudonocardiales bacterium]|nr:4-hydroxymandelate oxidase [Pseudonocardiales bacterium]